jgi:hypothetical protein
MSDFKSKDYPFEMLNQDPALLMMPRAGRTADSSGK